MPIYNPTGPEEWVTATLINSWVAFGAPEAVPRFRRGDGRVWLDGAAKTGTSGTVAFVLPVGYRPATDKVVNVLTSAGAGYAYVTASSGNVLLTQLTGAATTATYLDGASFALGV